MTDTPQGRLNQGRLEAIWLKRVRRGPMDPKERARLVEGQGLEDDANQRGKRQVTLISKEQWEKVCAELGQDLDPRIRRANLMVSGLDLAHTRGRVLKIGQGRLRIYGETRPCRVVGDPHPGLREALDPDWRGGVFGEVIGGGEIAVGDAVAFEDEPEAP